MTPNILAFLNRKCYRTYSSTGDLRAVLVEEEDEDDGDEENGNVKRSRSSQTI